MFMGFTKLVQRFLTIFTVMGSGLHRLLRGGDGGTRRVLLVARNQVAADYMVSINNLLTSLPNLEIHVTVDRFPVREFQLAEAESIVGARGIPIALALVQSWDLIIFTNHPYGPGVCFSPLQKKMYINHGLHTGKINSAIAEDGVYGRGKILRPFYRPFYHLMLAASRAEVKYAVSCTPELNGRVVDAGLLQADELMAFTAANRAMLRGRYGYTSDEKVVHVISTWGQNSLYGRYRDTFYTQMEDLAREHNVVFSLHPRFDYLDRPGDDRRNDILDRVERLGIRVNRDPDWQKFVAVADVAIADHSSLALYHVLLSHPLVLASVPTDQYVSGSTFDRLYRLMPKLDDYGDWTAAINETDPVGVSAASLPLVGSILDHKGEARTMYLAQFQSILGQ